MKRHNEQRKMDLKKKWNNNKKEKNFAKSQAERARMEKLGSPERIYSKFSLLFIGDSLKTFFIIHDDSMIGSFQVTLSRRLSVGEISQRMEKAFGDI